MSRNPYHRAASPLKAMAVFSEAMRDRMQRAGIGDEYDAFMASFDSVPPAGIRVSLSRVPDRGDAGRLLDTHGILTAGAVPWSAAGFYLNTDGNVSFGSHPLHHAGVYYLQEPSAMLPAEVLDARPGEHVLDLCAAPGGKSTRIAECMDGGVCCGQ